jgi:hypothetical protein
VPYVIEQLYRRAGLRAVPAGEHPLEHDAGQRVAIGEC